LAERRRNIGNAVVNAPAFLCVFDFAFTPASTRRENRRRMVGMVTIGTRVPAELAKAVDRWAANRRVTRSAVLRALIEDAVDAAGDLPEPSPSSAAEMIEQLRADDEAMFERLRELSRR
jgi:predicted DNA-binding protein